MHPPVMARNWRRRPTSAVAVPTETGRWPPAVSAPRAHQTGSQAGPRMAGWALTRMRPNRPHSSPIRVSGEPFSRAFKPKPATSQFASSTEAGADWPQDPRRKTGLGGRTCRRFDCGERAAADVLSILVRGHWLERSRSSDDRRESTYVLTERGRYILAHPRGPLVLRYARKLFTTCPSPRMKRRQSAIGCDGLDSELQRLERLGLAPV
jgi:hypothetical protein